MSHRLHMGQRPKPSVTARTHRILALCEQRNLVYGVASTCLYSARHYYTSPSSCYNLVVCHPCALLTSKHTGNDRAYLPACACPKVVPRQIECILQVASGKAGKLLY